MNNKIDLFTTLKQYNLTANKMSNSITKKEVKNLTQNISIKSLLKNLSLSINKTNQTIVSELLNHNLPLNKELISNLNDFLSNLNSGDNLETKVKVALLLKEIDLPLNKKFFNFFKNYLFSKEELKNNFKKLIKNLKLNNNFANLNQKNTTSKASQNKSKTNLKFNPLQNTNALTQDKLNTLLEKITLKPTEKNRTILKKLIDYKININKENFQTLKNSSKQTNQSLTKIAFMEQLNTTNPKLFNEINLTSQDNLNTSLLKFSKMILAKNMDLGQLANNIKDLITKEPQLLITLKENFSPTDFKSLSSKLNLDKSAQHNILQDGLKEEIVKTIITTNNVDPSSIKESINKLNLNNDKQLVKFLFQLSQESSKPEIQEKAEDLTKQLLNLKAVNYEAENTLLFLPVLFQEGLELAQIKFAQSAEKDTAQEKSFKFAFKVNTEKLGELEVKVKIKNEQLNLLFLTNKNESKELIEDNLNLLTKAFQNHKYKLNYLNCKLQNEQETEKNENQSLTTIDYTI